MLQRKAMFTASSSTKLPSPSSTTHATVYPLFVPPKHTMPSPSCTRQDRGGVNFETGLRRGKQQVRDAPASSSLSDSRWVRYVEASARVKDWRAGSLRPVSFYSWFACGGKKVPRGAGISLSSTPLLAEASLPSST